MNNVDNQDILIFGIFIAIGFALAIVATVTSTTILKFLLGLLAIFFALLGFFMKFYSYMAGPILAAIKKGAKEIIINEKEPFVLAPNGNAILKEEGGYFYATVFVRLPVYNSSTEMDDNEKLDFSNIFSKAISMSKNPIKITTQLNILDKDEYVEKVREKLNNAEIRYNTVTSNKDSKPQEVERVKGEVTMWHNLLDNILGVDSFIPISYIAVTAIGGNEEEATSMALQRANEIIAGVNSLYGVVANIITTPELFLLIEPDRMIPSSTISKQIKGEM